MANSNPDASGEELDFEVCPFTILVDTREQAPFCFRGLRSGHKSKNRPLLIRTIRATLQTGDYTIEGFERRIAIERKSKSDLFHCMGSDRERFENQIHRLNDDVEHPFVVVESSYESIVHGCDRSQLPGKTVIRTRISWEQKYPRVHWWFCPSVDFAEANSYRILETFWRHEHERK